MVEQALSPSRQVAISRRFCCVEDIDLLQRLVTEKIPNPIVLDDLGNVDISKVRRPYFTIIVGAGSGTMSLAWLEVREPWQELWSIDISQEALDWERKAWVAGGWGEAPKGAYQVCGASAEVGEAWGRLVNLVVLDGDHSEEAVRADLTYWGRLIIPGGLLMLHDYDATNAPEFSPGVKIAADELLTPDKWEFMGKEGWSAWWRRK